MNRFKKTVVTQTSPSFNGLPQARLARAMWAVGSKHVEGFWKSFTRREHYDCILRDCGVASRLEYGTLAWALYGTESFLIEVGATGWDKDVCGNWLEIKTSPPVYLGEDSKIGLEFLETAAAPRHRKSEAFYLIETGPGIRHSIEAASSFELLGRAAAHNSTRWRADLSHPWLALEESSEASI